jgi:hypothetical protein
VSCAVEKAAAVFSLKLDTGHKLLCPWIDNICDESLALFPPTPAPVLVENYYECFSSLLRLLALPRISCSSLETMKKRSPQLEQFLSEPFSSSAVLKGRFILTEDSTIKDLDDAFQDADAYYQVNLFFIYLWSCCNFFVCHIQEPHTESCTFLGDKLILTMYNAHIICNFSIAVLAQLNK